MAKLVLSNEGTVVDQCFLDRDRVTIGRAAGNRIVVDDPAVGDEHAAISAVGNDYILEDLRGGTGLPVNGSVTPRRILQHNDVVALGAFSLRYVDTKASEIDLDRTMLIPGLKLNPDKVIDGEITQDLHIPSTREAKARFPTGRVRYRTGAREGETKALDRVIATFGAPERCVAVLTRRPKGYYVTYVEGDAFPRVNGETLGREPRHLHAGDVIEVGGEELVFELVE